MKIYCLAIVSLVTAFTSNCVHFSYKQLHEACQTHDGVCSKERAAEVFCHTLQFVSVSRQKRFAYIIKKCVRIYDKAAGALSRYEALESVIMDYEPFDELDDLDWSLIKFLSIMLTDCHKDPDLCECLWHSCVACTESY